MVLAPVHPVSAAVVGDALELEGEDALLAGRGARGGHAPGLGVGRVGVHGGCSGGSGGGSGGGGGGGGGSSSGSSGGRSGG